MLIKNENNVKAKERQLTLEFQERVNFIRLLKVLSVTIKDQPQSVSSTPFTKEQYRRLIACADSLAERKRLRYAILQATNMSRTEAATKLGINESIENVVKEVEDSIEQQWEIQNHCEMMAKAEDAIYLQSLGIKSEEMLTELELDYSSSSDSESDNKLMDNDEVNALFNKPEDQTTGKTGVKTTSYPQIPTVTQHSVFDAVKSTTMFDINSVIALDVLKNCGYNWFEFVTCVTEEMSKCGYNDGVLNQFLIDFAGQIPDLGLSEEDEKLVEHTRQAFLALRREEEIAQERNQFEIEDSDSENEPNIEPQPDTDSVILKERRRIRAYWKRRAKVDIANRHFVRRKVIRSANSVALKYPDIGSVMEEFSHSCDTGADAWRRPGVMTFSGQEGKRTRKKLTFRRMQQHLEQHYKDTFSYGIVVQLCCARNRRRRSAQNYKGLAQIVHKRAYKGFNVKFNPDCHFTSALYRGLSFCHLKDGEFVKT